MECHHQRREWQPQSRAAEAVVQRSRRRCGLLSVAECNHDCRFYLECGFCWRPFRVGASQSPSGLPYRHSGGNSTHHCQLPECLRRFLKKSQRS